MTGTQDFANLNATLTEKIVARLGGQPQAARMAHLAETGKVFLGDIFQEIEAAYGALDLANADKAKAFNAMAFKMRALGYGEEAYEFAARSTLLDPNHVAQVAANMGCQAYVVGMIDGDYARGLALYEEADRYLVGYGRFNDVAAIKSAQNKGQIHHRMGLLHPEEFDVAVGYYESAIEKIENSADLTGGQKNQFLGQVGYCYAKTLACMAALDPLNTELQGRAMDQITRGMEFIESIKNFGFERACFVAVLGQVHAVCGDKANAAAFLQQAYDEQKAHGPTVVPRVVSTKLKLLDVTQPVDIEAQRVALLTELDGFYGSKGHHDLTVYAKKYPAAYGQVLGGADAASQSPAQAPRPRLA